MTTAAASPIAAAAAAAASPNVFPKDHHHPPYENMILSAIEALNSRKGSKTQAISDYIVGNYSGLARTHPTLLTHHLDRLISKGAIKRLNFSYKLSDGSKKSSLPKKPTALPETAAAAPVEHKKRGRPPKLKRKPGRPPKSTAPLSPASIYIIPQDTHLHSDILQKFPGAAAIVLPKSLLSERTACNSIIIFPNVIQSLIDASTCKRKPGRPRNADKRRPGRPRKKALELNQNPAGGGDGVNPAAKVPGRPWKIRDMLVPGITQTAATTGSKIAIGELEAVKKAADLGISESVHGTEETPRLNKRKSAGRPKKRPLIEGYPPVI
ncbi:hypothetical protein KSP39_PZI006773 [Platanthera zijinensis]|uniref:H15 domain-containing protein n=1 Tax=Platanthera zijinensis TaxID=2320716 RepID=A0AAP0BQI8_9ASPA